MKLDELGDDPLNEIIRKLESGKYRLYSHSGKNLGTYDTHAGAEKRERQVQYFKHANESAMGEEITDFNAQEPMASKVAVQGYGTMNLETLMKNVSSTIKQLGELRNDPSSYRRLNYELYDSGVLQAKIKAVITALDQLQDIKRKGGKRSVNIQKEAEQQELPIDLNKIGNLIDKLENKGVSPEDADKIRRAIQSLASGRQSIYPESILQLLTILAG